MSPDETLKTSSFTYVISLTDIRGPWACPFSCVRARGAAAPFCVTDSHTNIPCRAKKGSSKKLPSAVAGASVGAADLLGIGVPVAAAAPSPPVTVVDACIIALATVRSGEYLR